MDVSESLFNVFSIRSMIADFNGKGLAFIGPKGTKKTELFWSLLQDDSFRLHSNETAFVRFSGGNPQAIAAERKLFLPTRTVEFYPKLASLLDNSKCENVIVRKEDCQDAECLRIDDCRLDRGSPFCYKASKNAQALLDPYWIEGPSKHVKRTALHWLFLLRCDTTSPPIVEMLPEDALRIIESGESLGSSRSLGATQSVAFFNPHLLHTSSERIEHHKNFFRHLCSNIPCYLFNSGVATAEDIKGVVTGKGTETEEDKQE
jgi:hypothetical protein